MSLIEEHVKQEPPGIQAQQTQEEFMLSCVADGTAREVCEARWEAAHEVSPQVTPQPPPPGDVAGLLNENAMLRAELATRKNQLRQTLGVANRAIDERKAKDNAEKNRLISSIQMDSHFTKDELTRKTLGDLQTMRLTLDKSIEKGFASVAAEMDAASKKAQPLLTAGAWDRDKKRWIGGT